MGLEKRQVKAARLRYVSDSIPGIERVKNGRGFKYRRRGKTVRDPASLRRIKSLVIPPAWRDVWICPVANGHIQCTGRDERGRKQYLYHPRWDSARDEAKYDHMREFAAALPKIRTAVRRDLATNGLTKQKVAAVVVKLLAESQIRIGNDEYARDNGSFGLTTLQDRHAKIRGGKVEFRFRGKSGQWHDIGVENQRLAKLVRACQDLPGQQLFQYLDDDKKVRGITSTDVNAYIRDVAGDGFTAKDFRTWAGTVQAARALCKHGCEKAEKAIKSAVVEAVREVAQALGNTVAVCRKCYIHPKIFEAYQAGNVVNVRGHRARGGLSAEERAVLKLL